VLQLYFFAIRIGDNGLPAPLSLLICLCSKMYQQNRMDHRPVKVITSCDNCKVQTISVVQCLQLMN